MKIHSVVLYCLALVLICGCSSKFKFSDWWSEPVTAGPSEGSVATPGGGAYTPPVAPTEPVTAPVPGGGTVTYQPPASGPAVTKGDVVAQTGTGIAYAAGGPALAGLASVLFGVIGAALDKKKQA